MDIRRRSAKLQYGLNLDLFKDHLRYFIGVPVVVGVLKANLLFERMKITRGVLDAYMVYTRFKLQLFIRISLFCFVDEQGSFLTVWKNNSN